MFVRVPATIITSAWRGEARNTIPNLKYSEIHKTVEYEDDIWTFLCVIDVIIKQIVYHKLENQFIKRNGPVCTAPLM